MCIRDRFTSVVFMPPKFTCLLLRSSLLSTRHACGGTRPCLLYTSPGNRPCARCTPCRSLPFLTTSCWSWNSTRRTAAVAEPLIYCLIGPKWHEAATYLPLICISMSLYPLHAINLNLSLIHISMPTKWPIVSSVFRCTMHCVKTIFAEFSTAF